MAAKNETIFPLPLNAPSRAGATLFQLLSLTTKHSTLQFLSQGTGPLPMTGCPFRRCRSESLKLARKSYSPKDRSELCSLRKYQLSPQTLGPQFLLPDINLERSVNYLTAIFQNHPYPWIWRHQL
jgi:hypothetical protein